MMINLCVPTPTITRDIQQQIINEHIKEEDEEGAGKDLEKGQEAGARDGTAKEEDEEHVLSDGEVIEEGNFVNEKGQIVDEQGNVLGQSSEMWEVEEYEDEFFEQEDEVVEDEVVSDEEQE